jgi:DNA-binding protein H-NS
LLAGSAAPCSNRSENFGFSAIFPEGLMKRADLASMSIDELQSLYEEIKAALARKLVAEKAKLDARLRHIQSLGVVAPESRKRSNGAKKPATRVRRPYPKVLPKYRNPKDESQTWSGRGKQPRWLVAEIRRGKKVGDFLIKR